jgi:hypothetical protein
MTKNEPLLPVITEMKYGSPVIQMVFTYPGSWKKNAKLISDWLALGWTLIACNEDKLYFQDKRDPK